MLGGSTRQRWLNGCLNGSFSEVGLASPDESSRDGTESDARKGRSRLCGPCPAPLLPQLHLPLAYRCLKSASQDGLADESQPKSARSHRLRGSEYCSTPPPSSCCRRSYRRSSLVVWCGWKADLSCRQAARGYCDHRNTVRNVQQYKVCHLSVSVQPLILSLLCTS